MPNFNKCIFTDVLNIMDNLDKIEIGAIVTNKENCIINMNETAEHLTGWCFNECLGLDLCDVVRLREDDFETVLISKQNAQLNVIIKTSVQDYIFGQESYNITLIKDVTCSNIKNDVIEISESNLRTIFDSTYDAIIVHDLQGNILDVNKKMREMYRLGSINPTRLKIKEDLSAGNNPCDELPKIWENVIAGENRLFEWNAKRPGDNGVFEVEVYLARISLHYQDVILATVRDISDKKKAEQMIQYLSFHDKLTGLYNRAFFEKELLRLDTERELPISIIIGDVNGLKLANDAFGHLVGDELLKSAGNALRKACRQEDIIARWGGDEFIIILTNTDADTASRICERIHNECTKIETNPIILSIGLGYAAKTYGLQNVSEAIKEAEALMYVNKLKEGRENRQKIINSILAKQMDWDHDNKSMTELCCSLAKAYGLEDSKLEDIKLLANIHDIGKVSIPIEIIKKPGKLNEEEWEIIKKHSEIGYRIVSTYPEYAHLADSILSHHERWDGTGYPRQLKGEEISLEARILSIVDAYDAMVSGRPYKASLSHAEALKEISINKGSQFDPEIAQLFIDINNR